MTETGIRWIRATVAGRRWTAGRTGWPGAGIGAEMAGFGGTGWMSWNCSGIVDTGGLLLALLLWLMTGFVAAGWRWMSFRLWCSRPSWRSTGWRRRCADSAIWGRTRRTEGPDPYPCAGYSACDCAFVCSLFSLWLDDRPGKKQIKV